MEESPTSVCSLNALEVGGDFPLKLLVDRLATKVAEQNVFSRNLNYLTFFQKDSHQINITIGSSI